jgi:hypothetical protein
MRDLTEEEKEACIDHFQNCISEETGNEYRKEFLKKCYERKFSVLAEIVCKEETCGECKFAGCNWCHMFDGKLYDHEYCEDTYRLNECKATEKDS